MRIDAPHIYDVTLRDGNHALRHSLSPNFVEGYCRVAERAEIFAVEVGHGNGIGASSFLVGKSAFSDADLLTSARSQLSRVKLAIHSIPGFSTIERDLKPAIDWGVDLVRVATHCSEADVAEKQIKFLRQRQIEVQGVLMMSHMVTPDELLNQAKIHQGSGATAVIIMDSAGCFTQGEVAKRISLLHANLSIPIGFHAHNNLGLGVANAISAWGAGATYLDGSAMGLGAGAGNAQLEALAANLAHLRQAFPLDPFLELSQLVEDHWTEFLPRLTRNSIESAVSGAFSGYAPQVKMISEEMGIDRSKLWSAIGERKLVAGQESMIREIALDLMNL